MAKQMALFQKGVFIFFVMNLIFFFGSAFSSAENLSWYLTKDAAFTAAQQQNKKILLLAGRDT